MDGDYIKIIIGTAGIILLINISTRIYKALANVQNWKSILIIGTMWIIALGLGYVKIAGPLIRKLKERK